MLGKLHDPKLRCPGHAFVAPTIAKYQETNIRIVGLDLLAAPGNDDFNNAIGKAPLQENIFHGSICKNALTVDDRIVWPDLSKSARLDAAQVCFATRLGSDALYCLQCTRGQIHRQPGDTAGERHEQPHQRPVNASRPDSARHHGWHLAVPVKATKRQHYRQKQPDGNDYGQVLRGRQPDNIHCRLLRQSTFCNFTQNSRELIG